MSDSEGTIKINRKVVAICTFVTLVIACGVIGILSVLKKSNGAYILDIWSQQHDQYFNGLYISESSLGWIIYDIQGSGKVRIIHIINDTSSSETSRSIENITVEWISSKSGIMKVDGKTYEMNFSVEEKSKLKQLELKQGNITSHLYALITEFQILQ